MRRRRRVALGRALRDADRVRRGPAGPAELGRIIDLDGGEEARRHRHNAFLVRGVRGCLPTLQGQPATERGARRHCVLHPSLLPLLLHHHLGLRGQRGLEVARLLGGRWRLLVHGVHLVGMHVCMHLVGSHGGDDALPHPVVVMVVVMSVLTHLAHLPHLAHPSGGC